MRKILSTYCKLAAACLVLFSSYVNIIFAQSASTTTVKGKGGAISAAAVKEVVAIIARTVGTVEVLPAGTSKWQKAKVGMYLYQGDTVRTDKNAKAIILYANGAETKINELTELIIGEDQTQEEKKIRIRKGIIWNRTLGVRAKLMIRTPVAVIGVRGTQFDTSVEETTGDTSVYVYEGAVNIKNAFGAVEVPAGQKTTATGSAIPATPQAFSQEEQKQRTAWQENLKVTKKTLILKIKTEDGKEKTLKLQFGK
jgi:hypothetical protein